MKLFFKKLKLLYTITKFLFFNKFNKQYQYYDDIVTDINSILFLQLSAQKEIDIFYDCIGDEKVVINDNIIKRKKYSVFDVFQELQEWFLIKRPELLKKLYFEINTYCKKEFHEDNWFTYYKTSILDLENEIFDKDTEMLKKLIYLRKYIFFI